MDKLITQAQRITGWRHFPLVASFVLIVAFMVGFYWRDMVRGAMCSNAGDEHCTREWVAALGGWLAIIFAYLTIRTMTRQTEEANRHQKENVELQIIEKLSRAKRVRSACDYAQATCRHLLAVLEKAQQDNLPGSVDPRTHLAAIKIIISEQELAEVSRTANSEGINPFVALGYLEHWAISYYENTQSHGHPSKDDVMQINTFTSMAINGYRHVKFNAERFIAKWEPRVLEE